MKIQATRNDILNNLIFISKTINPKISTFILNGVVLEAEEKLIIYGTDLETSVKSFVDVNVLEKGKVVVPLKVIINILRNLNEAKIELGLNNEKNQLIITCEKARFTLNTLPIEEYPQFPEIKKTNILEIDAGKLKKSITKVQRAASIDESRAILTGILIEIKNGIISMVATDSYRLAVIEEEIKSKNEDIKIIVPAKVLDSIVKSDFKDNLIEISFEENQIGFLIGKKDEKEHIIVSRLLSGKFPEYNQLIPQNMKHNILIKKVKILEVVKRISSISQDNIPIKLSIEKAKMNISMNIKEVGSASEEFEISYGEESMEIAFNPNFLIDGINMIDTEDVIFSIEEPLKPILIKPGREEKLLYLLMPIRIS